VPAAILVDVVSASSHPRTQHRPQQPKSVLVVDLSPANNAPPLGDTGHAAVRQPAFIKIIFLGSRVVA
jgi:hypothetical protein